MNLQAGVEETSRFVDHLGRAVQTVGLQYRLLVLFDEVAAHCFSSLNMLVSFS